MRWPRRFLLWLPVAAYAGLIFLLSSRPGKDVPHFFPHDDKVIHFFEYLPFGALVLRAVCAGKGFRPALSVAAVFFTVLYAFSDEIHQTFVPGRTFSVFDILFDAGGAAAGMCFYHAKRWPR